ncbi:MAG: Asp-tRNA(Asn)/Glu-tRNA(Gln) amidotransferase subunit GatC [Candidatus Omnitrophica bacterium]|nr:Asp-tRNA(Asn)/Glu-tRNA(Gln) amidotransferase subunit GatC [Candidatus Omnitrophota bacterium]
MDRENIVDYISKLARINVSNEEKKPLESQLSRILEYVNKLKEADVTSVEPLRNLHTNNNVYRQDTVIYPFQQENILNNAPLKEDGYFKTPKVI